MTTLTLAGRVRTVAADIKLAHSIFAMPFALLAAFMAAGRTGPIAWSSFGRQLVVIVLAMIAARTFAMAANRLVDREIDARNPRTAGRALPSGRLTVGSMAVTLIASGLLFVAACAAFGILDANWWPLRLAVPVLAWLGVYGFLKRWTALCHFFLGSSLALSPLAATIAVDPAALANPAAWLIAGMVLTWVAGFDVIYSLQDVEVDRSEGLFSLPGLLGERKALAVSRASHVASLALLIGALAVDDRLGVIFACGIAVVAAALGIEHATVARWGRARIAMAFFTLNGVIACVLGAAGIADVLQ